MCSSLNMKFTPNTEAVALSGSNTNLTGAPPITDIVTGANDGTIISNITVKALQSTTQGMVRLFIYDPGSTSYFLYSELKIPATLQNGATKSFSVSFSHKLCLPAGYKIGVTTQIAEDFSVTVEGVNWTNCEC